MSDDKSLWPKPHLSTEQIRRIFEECPPIDPTLFQQRPVTNSLTIVEMGEVYVMELIRKKFRDVVLFDGTKVTLTGDDAEDAYVGGQLEFTGLPKPFRLNRKSMPLTAEERRRFEDRS